ncbi:hypothetical protein LOD99_15785 [Oopsacas minuta]|uniref:Strawberry notch helicase C domain-containing protein n=1 Tax=Oopsacas minuta TaxID=111878 RepID=A0AAV7K9P9_9METZ|nr:hypothetical protein LOD99_15785 [Oopsacas minuta]
MVRRLRLWRLHNIQVKLASTHLSRVTLLYFLGLYVSRQLSFNSVQFQIQEVPLTQAYIEVYNIACKFWVECRQKFLEALKLLSFDNRKMKYVMALFWAAHQRFFKYLCIASKVQGAVRLAKHAIRDNMCVVIGLQSTGESRLLDVLEERGGEISEFVSSAKGVLVTLIQRHFPAPYTSVKKKVIRKDVDNDLKSAVQAEASDSPVGSNPERDSALESDNSNSDTSEVNWEAVPSGDPGESLYTRYISSSETSAEDLNPFAEGSVPWLATKKTKKLKLDIEDDIPPEPEHSSPVAKQPQVLEMKEESPKTDPRDVYQITKNMKQDLLGRVEEIGVVLPNNTLDELIDCLGGPSQVSEMTGRKGRVVTQNVDTAVDEMEPGIKYERRSCLDVPIDLLNMEEKRRFMDGEVDIAIISEAASSGISLHADKRYKNQKQRLHITLELPWTADKAVQQFGRTHRSNQAMPPQYLFLISELAGERRFASVIARRLESLGALTRGDRKAASVESNDFSRFNFDTRDGLLALDSLLRCLIGRVSPLASSLRSADISTRQAAINALITVDILSRTPKGKITLDKESNSVSKFLNRLLGIEVQLQNTIFQWFLDTFDFLVKQAKRLGNWDNGIVEMGTNAGEEVERIKMEEFLG